MIACRCTIRSRKYVSSFWKYASLFARYFEANMGKGCLLEFSIRPVHTPLPPFLTIYVWGRQSRRQLRWTCTTGNQRNGTLVFTQVTCIVSGDRKPPRVGSHSWCEQQKPWWWPANKAMVHVFSVYVFLNTNDDRAELKAHKSMSRTVTLIYTRVKYLAVKKGEGIC